MKQKELKLIKNKIQKVAQEMEGLYWYATSTDLNEEIMKSLGVAFDHIEIAEKLIHQEEEEKDV